MNRRRLFAIGALVLAVPLFAWPIAFPPPDPPDTFTFHTTGGAVMEGGADVAGGGSMEGNASAGGEGGASVESGTSVGGGADVTREADTGGGGGMGGPAEITARDDIERVVYENLSADGQRIVERTIEGDGGNYQLQGDESVPEVFADTDFRMHVEYEDQLYRVHVHQRSPAPPLGALLSRLGSLVVAVVLGMTGGYLIVSNE